MRPLVSFSTAKAVGKKGVLSFARALGLHRLASPLLGGSGIIFALHRVVEPGETVLDPTQTIGINALERILAYLRRADFEIIALDEIPERLADHGALPRPRRVFVCFTFDDGYRDNLTLALPLFRRFQAPFAVYVLTGFPDRQFFYWWRGIERLVLQHDKVELRTRGGIRRLAARTLAEKRAAHTALCTACIAHPHDIGPALFASYGVDLETLLRSDTLSWSDLRQLAQDPLVTIGAHTTEHPILSGLEEHAARAEIAGGKARLETMLGIPIDHFAYPYGGPSACGPREYALAKQIGFKTAVTTQYRNIFPGDRHNLWSLPRIPLDDTDSKISDLQLHLSGISWAAAMRFRHSIFANSHA